LAAANGGHSYSYLATAEMYAVGKGTKHDAIEALAQVEIALRVLRPSETQNLERARMLRNQLAEELTQPQVREALRRAQEKRPDIMKVRAGAQRLSAEQLYGCWRHEAPRRPELPQRKAFMDLCASPMTSVKERHGAISRTHSTARDRGSSPFSAPPRLMSDMGLPPAQE
jgi:hypothetical protein